MKPTDPRSAYRLARILEILEDWDHDQKALTERLGMSDPRSIAKYLDHLRTERKIHTCGWTPRGVNGHAWPILRFGPGINKRRPKAPPHAEYQRAWKLRKGIRKASPANPFEALFK